LRGVSHARVASAAPRGDFVVVKCPRPSMRSFFDVVIFCGGFFACILHGSASLKTSPHGGRQMLELALPSKMIQRGSESDANKVLAQEGSCSINLASQGHCVGVFIGA
jgi:hypothetical protein